MMRFYADESGTLTSPSVFAVAGWMAVPSAWDRLIPKWRTMLCDTGPFPVSALHTKKLERAEPPYNKWSDAQRQALIDRASGLLTSDETISNLYAIASVVVVDDFSLGASTWRPTQHELYMLCFRSVLLQLATFPVAAANIDGIFDERWARRSESDPFATRKVIHLEA